MRATDRRASEVGRKFEPVPQILKNVRYTNGLPLEEKLVKEAIEDARSMLGNTGRLVIRPSGTEPLIRIMAEGDDKAMVRKIVNGLVETVSKCAA